MTSRLDPPPMVTAPAKSRALERPLWYSLGGIIGGIGDNAERPLIRVTRLEDWEPREHTAGVGGVRLEVKVDAYGDDTTGVYARIAGTDLAGLLTAWRNLRAGIPPLLTTLWKGLAP